MYEISNKEFCINTHTKTVTIKVFCTECLYRSSSVFVLGGSGQSKNKKETIIHVLNSIDLSMKRMDLILIEYLRRQSDVH